MKHISGWPPSRATRAAPSIKASSHFVTTLSGGVPLRVPSLPLFIRSVQTIASCFQVLSLSRSRWLSPSALSPCRASKSIRENLKSTENQLIDSDEPSYRTPPKRVGSTLLSTPQKEVAEGEVVGSQP